MSRSHVLGPMASVCLLALTACQLVYDADDFRDQPRPVDAAPDGAIDASVDGPVADAPIDGPRSDGGTLDCLTACTNGVCIPGTPNDVCHINCNSLSDCSGDVQCPPGLECIITCDAGHCPTVIDCDRARFCSINCIGNNSCAADINCGAGGCQLRCTGDQSCGGAVQCGTGLCDVTCQGSKSCGGAIDCQDSCECRVDCQAQDSCQGTTACPPGCADGIDECTHLPDGCSECTP